MQPLLRFDRALRVLATLAAIGIGVPPISVSAQVPATAPAAVEREALTLGAVYRGLQAANPRLAAAGAQARAAAARIGPARTLPDPQLQLGLMNRNFPGFGLSDPLGMNQIQVMQMVPFPGKLGASAEIARQETRVADAQADEAWWETRAELGMAFYELYALDAQLDVMRGTLRLLTDLEIVARAMYASGEGRQSDVLRASVEVARMDADIRRMTAMRIAAEAQLAAVLGDSAFAVAATALSPLPATLPAVDTLVVWAETSRPMLRGARAMVERAEAARDLARRELWPDVTVGLEYGQRPGDMDMGTERMVGVMLGFSLPVFASRRQLPMRAETEAMERMARADLAQERADVAGRIRGLVAELERARTLLTLYRNEILPQARANVESAYAAYRSGSVDFMTVVDARMAVNEFEQDLHELVAQYGAGITELEMNIGRELPVVDAIDTEAP
jgi:outer membrane protein TolC